MKTYRLLLLGLLLVQLAILLAPCSTVTAAPQAQENLFEFPVQLIGFPVIILAVRLSNFVKKLAYSLNPKTYIRRSRRSAQFPEPPLDVVAVEKRLVAELGPHVCVFEKVCDEYAEQARQLHDANHVLDWDQVFRGYESSPNPDKRNYLLSVFLGDIVASPGLCHQLAKRGRGCKAVMGLEDHDLSTPAARVPRVEGREGVRETTQAPVSSRGPVKVTISSSVSSSISTESDGNRPRSRGTRRYNSREH